MGHYGKHIIDPETGLCEICDKDAIRQVRQGKRPRRQVYYSDRDDDLTYRSNDEIIHIQDPYEYETNDEATPRYIRKPVYLSSTVRPRPPIYEQPADEPVVVRRKLVRHTRTPPEEVVVRRLPPPRPKTFYYVDNEGQMLPQSHSPPPEPPRRYVVQHVQPPPGRTVRVVRRRAQTPSPPSQLPPNESVRIGPKRQINSDTKVLERQLRVNDDNLYDRTPSPKMAEMYHIEASVIEDNHSTLDSPIHMSHDISTPPPQTIHRNDETRKPLKLESIERQNHIEPGQTVVRRVYRKLPPGQNIPPNDEPISNASHPQTIRKTGVIRLPPRYNRTSPQLTNRSNRNPELTKNPSTYYIRPKDFK